MISDAVITMQIYIIFGKFQTYCQIISNKNPFKRYHLNNYSDLYRHYLVDIRQVVGRKVLLLVLPGFAVASGHGEPYSPDAVLVVHPVERLRQFHPFLPSLHCVE